MTARLSGLTVALGVLALGLVAAGLLWPGGGRETSYAALDPAAPVRLEVRSLRIDAPVVPIAVSSDRVLDPPADAEDVGWWSASARPGAAGGQTVIAGHTVHTGGGALDELRRVRAGDTVDVRTSEGTMRYEVTAKRVLSREALARRAASLFGQDGGVGRLVLVSCTDWDGYAYESNVVVLAEPLGEPVRDA